MRILSRSVSWRTYGLAFAIVLSPALLQDGGSGCAQPGDTTLSEFQFRVFSQDHINNFDSDQRVYYVWLPSAADTADVVAYSTDTDAEVTYQYLDANEELIDAGWFTSFNGGGQMTLDGLLPPGGSVFRVYVKTSGTTFAKNYTAIIQVGCSDCDDGNVCTQDECDPTLEVCVHPAQPGGTMCDAGGIPGVCVGTTCAEFCSATNCDDGNLCTDDTCDSTLGVCEHATVADGSACGSGICNAGNCACAQGCDDGNICTDDTCNPAADQCDYTPVADGTACPGLGSCSAGSCVGGTFACTEQGILNAIAAGGGPHTFDCAGPTTVVTNIGPQSYVSGIVIDNDVILDGEGNLTVDGNQNGTVFWVSPSVTTELHGMTMTNGHAGLNEGSCIHVDFNADLTLVDSTVLAGNWRFGQCIDNRGTLTIIDSVVMDPRNDPYFSFTGIRAIGPLTMTNSTVSGFATGIFTSKNTDRPTTLANSTVSGNYLGIGADAVGTLTLTNVTVSGNGASGIDNLGGTVTLTNSTVSGNGGWEFCDSFGIYNSGGTVTLTNSTVSENGDLGIFTQGGTVTLTNSTVSGNGGCEQYFLASGIVVLDSVGTLTLTNTVVDNDCNAFLGTVSGGHNIESPGNTCGFNQTGDQPGVTEAQLNLGPLTDNGGPTLTHKPGDGGFGTESFAIDQIPEAACDVIEDQRGEPRPVVIVGPESCDVGAVEVQP